MSKESDTSGQKYSTMSRINDDDVLERYGRVINTDDAKHKMVATTKSNFSNSTRTLKEGDPSNLLLGKHKFIEGSFNTPTPSKSPKTASTFNATSPQPSHREGKHIRLKINWIAAQAQIKKLKMSVNHERTKCNEMQRLFEEEKTTLIQQHKRDEQAFLKIKDRLQKINEQSQDDLNGAMKQYQDELMKWDKEKSQLHKQLRDLKDQLVDANIASIGQQSDIIKKMEELLQGKIAQLESLLNDWKTTGVVCDADSARSLIAAMDAALQQELSLVSDNTFVHSQLAQLKEDMTTLKYERDKAIAKLNELMTFRKNQDSVIHCLGKTLKISNSERDSYRQQLDGYEKEFTYNICEESEESREAVLSARVKHLEKALQNYRDLVQNNDLDSQNDEIKNLQAELSKWRDKAEVAKQDSTKLQKQRDSLQRQFENFHIFDASTIQVHELSEIDSMDLVQKQAQQDLEPAQGEMHEVIENPTTIVQKQAQADMRAAQEEEELLIYEILN